MGVNSSKDYEYGVPVNPRVDYAVKRSKKENRIMRLDTSPLVKLPNATLQYRYQNEGTDRLPREKPHEGTCLTNKYHYFIHHNTKGSLDDGTSGNYCYVYKGPERARQKQIYYVFGKGLKAQDNGFLEPRYKPEEQSFERPIFYKTHGHIYMDIIILKKDPVMDVLPMPGDSSSSTNHTNNEGTDHTENDILEHTQNNSELTDVDNKSESLPNTISEPTNIDNQSETVPDKNQPEETLSNNKPPHKTDESSTPAKLEDFEVCLPVETVINDIKAHVARKYSTLPSHIHLYLRGTELRCEQRLKNLTKIEKRQKEMTILLHPK